MFCVRRWRLSGTGFTPLRCRFFRDFVVATDIRSADSRTMRITISLDQTHFAGPVIGSETSGTWDGLPWVHHDGRGYVSLDGAPVMVGTDVQKGTWDRIDPFYKDKTQQGRVFKYRFEYSVPNGRLCLRFPAVPGCKTYRTVCMQSNCANSSERCRMSGCRIRENRLCRSAPGREICARRQDNIGWGTRFIYYQSRPDAGPQTSDGKQSC